MLHGVDALREAVVGVVVEHRHGPLGDDGAGVETFVDEVHGHAGDLDAVAQGVVDRRGARESGQQRRVQVDDATGEELHELRRHQAHVAGQHHQVGVDLADGGGHGEVVLHAGRLVVEGADQRGDAGCAGTLEGPRPGHVAHDQRHFYDGRVLGAPAAVAMGRP